MKPTRRLIDLVVSEVSLVSAPANPEARVTLFKSAAPQKESQMDEKTETVAEPEITKAEAPVVEEPKAEEPVEAPVEKAAEEPVESDIEKSLRAEIEKARTEKAEIEKVLAAERRIAKVAAKERHVAVAMKALPTSAAELAENLVKLEEIAPEVAQNFEALLAQAAELIGKSMLLEARASAAAGDTTTEARVASLVKKKITENPGMSVQKAESIVYRENPELYTQYLKDKAEAA